MEPTSAEKRRAENIKRNMEFFIWFFNSFLINNNNFWLNINFFMQSFNAMFFFIYSSIYIWFIVLDIIYF